ncbi:hypothetical protein Tco_0912664, partial [Tanacetum coccineum]
LPPDVYALFNHQETAKDIWDKVKLLMKGIELSYQQLYLPQPQAKFPQMDSTLAVPMFQQGEDPIECINKAMTFVSAMASRFKEDNLKVMLELETEELLLLQREIMQLANQEL